MGLEYLSETRELRLAAGLFMNLCANDGVLILCFHAEMSVIRSMWLYFKEYSEQIFRSHWHRTGETQPQPGPHNLEGWKSSGECTGITRHPFTVRSEGRTSRDK